MAYTNKQQINGSCKEKIYQIYGNIWKTDKGLYIPRSTCIEIIPDLNIEVEIINVEMFNPALHSPKQILEQSRKRTVEKQSSANVNEQERRRKGARIGKMNCPTCNKAFTTAKNLKQHETRYHSNFFTCKRCSKNFWTEIGLEKHKLASHSDKNVNSATITKEPLPKIGSSDILNSFVCTICHEVQYGRMQLSRHIAMHSQSTSVKSEEICTRLRTKDTLKKCKVERLSY